MPLYEVSRYPTHHPPFGGFRMAPRYGADAFSFLAWARGRLDEAEDVKMDETHPRGWIAAFLQRFITMDF